MTRRRGTAWQIMPRHDAKRGKSDMGICRKTGELTCPLSYLGPGNWRQQAVLLIIKT